MDSSDTDCRVSELMKNASLKLRRFLTKSGIERPARAKESEIPVAHRRSKRKNRALSDRQGPAINGRSNTRPKTVAHCLVKAAVSLRLKLFSGKLLQPELPAAELVL
jgi:hypothetical protein